MQPELTRVEMTCPLSATLCTDGVRDDFEPNKEGKIKQCRLWTHVAGKDPQGEKVVDHYDCAWAWMPVVGLEQSQMTRHNTATMQEFRNETHEGLSNFNKAINQAALAFNAMAQAQQELISGVTLPAIENKENNGNEN